jgi:hypothetical protein
MKQTPSLLKLVLAAGILTLWVSFASAQQAAKPANWDAWQFLLGEWEGEGGGSPGQGTGGFTFSLDLQKRILVRKNRADYPATEKQPAYSHEDLMVIYQDAGQPVRAVYFDNEGHVIHYTVEFSPDQNSVIFTSEAKSSEPRYRLTYAKASPKSVTIKFEIALPDKPSEFKPYIQAAAHQKQNGQKH